MRGATLATLLLLLAVSACAGSDGAELTPEELPRLVLQPADLSADFERFDEGRQASADAPPGNRADPGRFGRVEGWKARFRRAGTRETTGPLVVESRVDVFADADGAADEVEAFRRELVASGGRIRTAPRDLGDEGVLATTPQASLPGVVFVTVVWRHGNATASIAANGFVRRLRPADVVALARKQQARLERESR